MQADKKIEHIPLKPQKISQKQVRNDQIILFNKFEINSRNSYVKLAPRNIWIYQEQNSTETISNIDLNNQIRFQIIFEDNDNPSSSIIGFILKKDTIQPITFKFLQFSNIYLWIDQLRKTINQQGLQKFYRTIKIIGKGGSAKVYHVERKTDSKDFAIKALTKAKINTSKQRAAIQNQLQILRNIKHQNLIKTFGIYQSQNTYYIVQELIKYNLKTFIQENHKQIEQSQTVTIIGGLLKALKHLSEKRIIHRDIKPDNILLRDNLEPVICDFGLATYCDSQPYIYHRCGSIGYLSPQVINSREHTHIEPACDIYSLGIIFHYLLTGSRYFYGSTFEEIKQSNRSQQFNQHDQRYQNVHPVAFLLLKSMLLRNPAERITPQNALSHEYFQLFSSRGDEINNPESPNLMTPSEKCD